MKPEAETNAPAEKPSEKTINPFHILEVEEAGESSYPLPSLTALKEKKPTATYTIYLDAEEKVICYILLLQRFQRCSRTSSMRLACVWAGHHRFGCCRYDHQHGIRTVLMI